MGVLVLELNINLGLVELLPVLGDVFSGVSSLLGVIILLLFKVYSYLLNLLRIVLLLLPEDLILLLLLHVIFDFLWELTKRLRFFHFSHSILDYVAQLYFMQFDELLVSLHVWIILKLFRELLCLVPQFVWNWLLKANKKLMRVLK